MKGRSFFIIIIGWYLYYVFPFLSMIENIISTWYWERHAWFGYQIPTHTARYNMILPQDCPKAFTINTLGLCRVYCGEKKVLDLWRSIACLGGISNKDNAFRHGSWKRWKDLYWYLHRSINNFTAYIVGESLYMCMEHKAQCVYSVTVNSSSNCHYQSQEKQHLKFYSPFKYFSIVF